MTIVAVTGGRGFWDQVLISRTLDSINDSLGIVLLVHGGCSGADKGAACWADERLVQTAEFRVTVRQWNERGKSAGPIRNRLMLKVTRPDLLIAFPGGKGTADCIAAAEELGIEVRRVK